MDSAENTVHSLQVARMEGVLLAAAIRGSDRTKLVEAAVEALESYGGGGASKIVYAAAILDQHRIGTNLPEATRQELLALVDDLGWFHPANPADSSEVPALVVGLVADLHEQLRG